MAKRVPAFARELAEARKNGMVPSRGEVIVALDVWAWGKPQHSALARCCVPPDVAPADLDLLFLAGLDVLVAWSSKVTDGERVMELARALLAIRPGRLLLLDMVQPTRLQWIKSTVNGVEVAP